MYMHRTLETILAGASSSANIWMHTVRMRNEENMRQEVNQDWTIMTRPSREVWSVERKMHVHIATKAHDLACHV